MNTLPSLDAHKLIMGGDLNLVLKPVLDRLSNKPIPLSKSAKVIHTFLNTCKITDPWRFMFPNQRKYSFFFRQFIALILEFTFLKLIVVSCHR